jgi:hypothetical protein
MAEKKWQIIMVRYCEHAAQEVEFEVELVLPAENLPEQPPRVLAHRCSRGLACNIFDEPSCIWAGTNPDFDPFQELGK